MLKKKKRGSLALSMNAIVILIMAIAMLGVGLGVIQMVRQKAESSLEQIAAEEPEASVANPSNPLTVSRSTIPVEVGGEFILKVSYYNNNDANCKSANQCSPKIGCTGITLSNIETINKTISQYDSASFIYKAELPSGVSKGFNVCTIGINNGGSETKDIVIKVI